MRRESYTTIQELIDGGYTLRAYCHNPRCHHNQRLDLYKLRDKLGPDHSTMHADLVPKLSCSKCKGQRGKAIGLILSPPGGKDNAIAHSSN